MRETKPETHRLAVVKYFDEKLGLTLFEVRRKDALQYAYYGDFVYGWRTVAQGLREDDAYRYVDRYRTFLREENLTHEC